MQLIFLFQIFDRKRRYIGAVSTDLIQVPSGLVLDMGILEDKPTLYILGMKSHAMFKYVLG